MPGAELRQNGAFVQNAITLAATACGAPIYRKVFIPLKVQRTDDVKRTIGFDRSQTSATSGGGTN
jgi:hypothetical protein